FDIVILNIGRSPAHDVTFDLSEALPNKAFGKRASEAKVSEEMVDGPLIQGIPFLPPNGKRVIRWGQLGGLVSCNT
ncbi:MAG: hypothetical protein QMD09_08835, partial [Desulfatibacillaceae bacterium]|nr:hypothetical protein [Desulfatibacillaceae bacterium]